MVTLSRRESRLERALHNLAHTKLDVRPSLKADSRISTGRLNRGVISATTLAFLLHGGSRAGHSPSRPLPACATFENARSIRNVQGRHIVSCLFLRPQRYY